MSLQQLIKTTPAIAFPKANRNPYKLLMLLSSGAVITEDQIASAIGRNYRSALQSLMNEKYYFWNILPQYNDKGLIYGRKLDPRHLSEDPRLDAKARAERRLQLAQDSLKIAVNGNRAIAMALFEVEDAMAHLVEVLKENALVK